MAMNTSNISLFRFASIYGVGRVFNCLIYSDLTLLNNKICRLGFNLEPQTILLCK